MFHLNVNISFKAVFYSTLQTISSCVNQAQGHEPIEHGVNIRTKRIFWAK